MGIMIGDIFDDELGLFRLTNISRVCVWCRGVPIYISGQWYGSGKSEKEKVFPCLFIEMLFSNAVVFSLISFPKL